jgi:hydrogenase maturation protease
VFVKSVTEKERGAQLPDCDFLRSNMTRSAFTVVVGLGNDLLTDDGVGLYVARHLRSLLDPEQYEVVELSVGGMELVEHLVGYQRAVVIDACRTGRHPAGTLTRHSPDDFAASPRLTSFHTIDFATALELARRLGLDLPETIDLFAVEAEDCETIGEGCTPRVESSIEPAARAIEQFLQEVRQVGRV